MDAANDLLPLLPEVQEALSEHFDGVECSTGPGVVLAQAPFCMPFAHLGTQVTFVPDTTCLDDFSESTMHRIPLGTKSAVFTDGEPGGCLELILGRGKDWKTPLTALFSKIYPNKWAFFVAELEQGQATYHVLSSSHGILSTSRREDTPDSTAQSSVVSSSSTSGSDTSNYSLWIVPVTKIFAVPAPKKVRVVKKIVKKKSPTNEDGTPVIETPSDPSKEKKVRIVKKKVPLAEAKEKELSPENEVGQIGIVAISSSETLVNGGDACTSKSSTRAKSPKQNGTNGRLEPSVDVDSSDGSASELRKRLSEQIIEEKFLVNGEQRRLNGTSPAIPRGLRPSLSRSSMTPDRRLDPILEGKTSTPPIKIVNHGATPPPATHQVCRISHPSRTDMPVVVLQLLLQNCCSYAQMGKLREVHPHWDEVAGQLMNSGYYKLLERADRLLMALQRKVVVEPALHYATSIMTNIQVHILNHVDVMRAVIDEGVCCFPYGVILDKTFLLLDRVQSMLDGNYEETVNWEPVASLSKKASIHYRTYLERVMEERMGENLRLKAAQRIIRLDSFMVDAQVQKLEKESSKAKEDLRWEINQLHEKNSQLRRENRELKTGHMRLEARVEVLEGKFKTLARLLS